MSCIYTSDFRTYKTNGDDKYVVKIAKNVKTVKIYGVRFWVMASHNADIVFYTGDDPHDSPAYWITIDGWGDQHRAAIRRCDKLPVDEGDCGGSKSEKNVSNRKIRFCGNDFCLHLLK